MKYNRDKADNIQVLITVEDKALVNRAARYVAAKYCPPEQRHTEQKELYHYGIIGLLQAKQNFDPSKQIPFAAFAVQRIRGEMISYLRVNPLVHQPQLVRKSVKELQQARHDLESVGHPATTKDIVAKLGWDQKKVQQVASIRTTVVSISSGRRGNGEEEGIEGDRDFACREDGPEKTALRRELAKLFAQCLEGIGDSRDRLILVARLLHDRTLQDLAEYFDCTAESIRQRQKKALDSIRSCFEKNGWDKYSIGELEPAMGKDETIMKAMQIWQSQPEGVVHGTPGGVHLKSDALYRLAECSGLKEASEQELEHLSLCPICLAAWVEWQESLQILKMTDSGPAVMMTYGLLKAAASTEWKEPQQLESACGRFLLTVFPELDSPGRGLITLELKAQEQDTAVEGQRLVVRDAEGMVLLAGTLRDGRLAGRNDNLYAIKLASWTIVSENNHPDDKK